MKKSIFYLARPENLQRLANYLKLNVEGMSHKQIARLIYWRLSRSLD